MPDTVQTPIARRKRIPENITLIPGFDGRIYSNAGPLYVHPYLGNFVYSQRANLSDPFVNWIQFVPIIGNLTNLGNGAPINYRNLAFEERFACSVAFLRLYFEENADTSFFDLYHREEAYCRYGSTGTPPFPVACPVFGVRAFIDQGAITDESEFSRVPYKPLFQIMAG